MSPILGIWASQNYPRSTTAYESIATATGNGTSGTITFSSIPATYTHLQIRYMGQTARATYPDDALGMQFNSDTGSNYSYHILRVDETSTTVIAESGANQTGTNSGYGSLGGSGGSSLYWGVGVIDILDYANTNKYKTVRILAGGENNTAISTVLGSVGLSSGLWRSTSAITSVSLYSAATGANFTTNTQFALYGIKGS